MAQAPGFVSWDREPTPKRCWSPDVTGTSQPVRRLQRLTSRLLSFPQGGARPDNSTPQLSPHCRLLPALGPLCLPCPTAVPQASLQPPGRTGTHRTGTHGDPRFPGKNDLSRHRCPCIHVRYGDKHWPGRRWPGAGTSCAAAAALTLRLAHTEICSEVLSPTCR